MALGDKGRDVDRIFATHVAAQKSGRSVCMPSYDDIARIELPFVDKLLYGLLVFGMIGVDTSGDPFFF